MARRFLFLVAGALLLPGVASGAATQPQDFVAVAMRHSQQMAPDPLGDGMGELVVIPPGGHHVILADDGATCHLTGGSCSSRVALPEGTEASGVWVAAYAPQRTHNLWTGLCLPPGAPPPVGCVVVLPWPDDPYLQYDLSFAVAGWQGGSSVRCQTATGAAWTLDYDAQIVTPTCLRYPLT